MNIAFYAPLKSPNHPNPSGDRYVGRALIDVFKTMNLTVELISEFRSYEGKGNYDQQIHIKEKAAIETKRILSDLKIRSKKMRPKAWVTYHLYHKAPDWIGPVISSELDIPYIVVEASFSPKQEKGEWGFGHRQVEETLKNADHIIVLSDKDYLGIANNIKTENPIRRLKPFLSDFIKSDLIHSSTDLKEKFGITKSDIILSTAAMMRYGDKYESYRYLSSLAHRLNKKNSFSFFIAGGGPAFDEVKKLFPKSTIFLGQLERNELLNLYKQTDIFIWPALKEAYGIALLEAQFMGVPSIVGDTGGTKEIVKQGETGFLIPCKKGIPDEDLFIEKTETLISNQSLRKAFAKKSIEKSQNDHSIKAAIKTFVPILKDVF